MSAIENLKNIYCLDLFTNEDIAKIGFHTKEIFSLNNRPD